jgi:cell division protein FtsQ
VSRTWRPRRGLLIALLLLGVVILGGAVYVAYFSPLLVVRQVSVSGNQQLRAEQIVAAAQVPMGTPLALQDVEAIARRATTLPAVQAASVSRTWPDTIRVTVTERRPLLAVRQPGGFALVDSEGVAFAESGSVPGGVMLVEVNPTNRPLLQDVGAVAAALPGDLGRQVSMLGATDADRIILKLKSGVTVQWGNAADSPLKAEIVAAMLKSTKAAAIDVSSPHNPAAR